MSAADAQEIVPAALFVFHFMKPDWRLLIFKIINAPLRALMSRNYRANYLRSKDWRERSDGFIAVHLREHPEDRGKTLHVHHLHYDNIGRERLGRDVIVITREAHERIHRARFAHSF